MYYRYFGLKEAPFSIAVNPRYLYMSARHREALAHLVYGVGAGSGAGGGGFILLTGEVGTGKTTTIRCLLEQLPKNTDIAIVLNPALNTIELLATICDELSIAYLSHEQSLKVLTDKLHQFLLDNYAKGRNTVLLIDEAQHLQFKVLEQIRLLTNLETNTKKLLQIILVGQPELRTLLQKPELRQLAQRITARYQLKPLSIKETQDYIRHRLHVAGLPANQELFPFSVIKGLHKVSRGVPRIINVLCDRMLLGTYGKNKTMVDKTILKQATLEVMGDENDLRLHRTTLLPSIIAIITFVLLAGLAWWNWPQLSQSIPKAPFSEPVSNHTAPETQASPPVSKPAATIVTPKPEILAPASPVSEPITLSTPDPTTMTPTWYSDKSVALIDLVTHLDFPADTAEECFNHALRCETLSFESWQELLSYNRPGVLSLTTADKLSGYGILLAIHNNNALIIRQGEKIQLTLEALTTLWTGEYTFIWQAPKVFNKPVSLTDSGPIIQWLAEAFATIDEQDTLLADDIFNMPLTNRVKIFQSNHQLKPDGSVGVKTILKLNERIGVAKTLNTKSVKEI